MKILYLDHPEADFLSAIVYAGLCEELGADSVVDYPFKPSYHGQVHRYPSPYTISMSPGLGLPWLRSALPDDSMGVTAPFSWATAYPGQEWSRDEVIARLGEFDLAILASPRAYNAAALDDLVAAVGRDKLPPLALMDGEDYSTMRVDVVDKYRPKVYFKRELLPGASAPCRVVPLPFGSPILSRDPVAKDIDILFLGGNTWPGRAQACEVLQREFGDRFVGGVKEHIPHAEYLDVIARAKISVSVRGFGNDTLKFWEIPSMPGTLLVADKLPTIKPFPFEHGVNILYFDGVGELVEAVRCALEDEPWRARVAAAGNAWLREHHTARARAQQVLEACR